MRRAGSAEKMRCVKPQLLFPVTRAAQNPSIQASQHPKKPRHSPGIHGYEYGTSRIQFEHCILEKEFHNLASNGPLDGQDLLRHHGEHLQLDAIELVEAGPGARLCQTLQGIRRNG